MRSANRKKGKSQKRTKLKWRKKTSDAGVIYEAPLSADGVVVAVGEVPGGWIVALYNEETDSLWTYPDYKFASPEAAKLEVQALVDASIHDVRRVANREIGDVVLAAEQYFEAQEAELALMKRGTPSQLSAARKRTKKAKEALEDMTGANRELYGAMGGGTLGAAIGAMVGNPLAAAVGALAGSVVGSLLGRPTLVETPPSPAKEGGDVVPLRQVPRRRPYAANPD